MKTKNEPAEIPSNRFIGSYHMAADDVQSTRTTTSIATRSPCSSNLSLRTDWSEGHRRLVMAKNKRWDLIEEVL